MKKMIMLALMLSLQAIAFGDGGEGGGGSAGGNGGGSGGSKFATRSIANVAVDEQIVKESIDSFATVCLQTLDSVYKFSANEKDYRLKLNDEIVKSIRAKKNDRTVASVDTIHYPECYAYAKETDNEIIKSLLRRTPEILTNENEEISPPSSIAK